MMRSQKRTWAWGVFALGAACILGLLPAGCSTARSRDAELERLLRGVKPAANTTSATAPVPAVGPDAPEPPVSDLPPLPREAAAPARGVVTIQPDSLVHVRVKEDTSLDGSYTVNQLGAVDLPYVGPVFLLNKTAAEAESKIREILQTRGAFRNATVEVKIVRPSYDRVGVYGAVNQPGEIKIGAGDVIPLNDALLRAGGVRPSATGAKVRIVQGGLLSAVVLAVEGDVLSLVSEEGKPAVPDVKLRNNDFVYVFSSAAQVPGEVGEKEVVVVGEVARPGVYRFAGGEPCTMMHLLFKMGALPPYANRKGIRILRKSGEGVETPISVNADRLLEEGRPEDDVALENGDRIVVPARKIHLF